MANLTATQESGAARSVTKNSRAGDLWADRVFRGVAFGAGLTVLAVLALIAYSTTKEAWPAFRDEGLSFFTSDTWAPNRNEYGALAFIWGTLYTSAIAVVLAVPLSLGIALFTTELAPQRMRRPTIYVIDLLAAIPSVVYGLWGIIVLAPWIGPKYQTIADSIGQLPLLGRFFGPPVSGGRG